MNRRAFSTGLLMSCALAPATWAQDARPLRIIVPYGAGGITDSIARQLAEAMRPLYPRPLVIENRPGGGGMVALRGLMAQGNDGSALLLTNLSNHVVLPLLLSDAKYDPMTDLVPVSSIGSTPAFLFTRAGFPADSMAEFLARARSRRSEMTFATSGLNTIGWLTLMSFQKMAGIDGRVVPYKGGDEMTLALMRGEVDAMLSSPTAALMEQVAAGRIKLLAVTTRRRTRLMPEMPTVSESVPGFQAENWWVFLSPKGTHGKTWEALDAALAKVVQNEKLKESLSRLFVDLSYHSGPQVAQEMRAIDNDLRHLTRQLGAAPQ